MVADNSGFEAMDGLILFVIVLLTILIVVFVLYDYHSQESK
jgi:hypothetical protein